jgi:hypothetical protein
MTILWKIIRVLFGFGVIFLTLPLIIIIGIGLGDAGDYNNPLSWFLFIIPLCTLIQGERIILNTFVIEKKYRHAILWISASVFVAYFTISFIISQFV